ncbi:ribonuclease HI [Roseiflexus castenholzii]|jgi:ribonuclease HI|uniref:Ribonuclease H n=1 Tax=Roseiflexus castenholzii (strain DSM 13941 / HLO8) TaxID=383372 RepID=A7NII6_ROSCS|nr:ribonuclease HI [Roseiflexus castenholzii]ABU57286.1 Ribonuclease H [Roseiflexus castenholzii DSM 13941]
MSSKKKQYYIVVKGRNPGVYTQWFGKGEAAEQVEGFPEAVYKSFYTHEEAINWLKSFPKETLLEVAPNLATYLDTYAETTVSTGDIANDLLNSGKVVMFTDGCFDSESGSGGYGVILKHRDRTKEISGGFRETTNNRMEIRACIEGLRALKRPSEVVIFSDSKYVVDSMSKGWVQRWKDQGWMRNEKDQAENSDLWEQLLELCNQHRVEFRWVKGHNHTKENERCDQLASEAAKRSDLPIDRRSP